MDARHDRYPYVDSLRGLAALTVLTVHAVGFFGTGYASGSAIRPYLARGEVAVTVFLLISGFLLYRPFARANVRGEPALRIRGYAWRRFLRIAPAYWLALPLAALWVALHGLSSPRGWGLHMAFGQLYDRGTMAGGLPQTWTVALEVTFYAALPVWALGMRRLGTRWPRRALRLEAVGVVCLIAVSLTYKAVVLGSGAATPLTIAPVPLLAVLPGYLDAFAVGMGLALLSIWLEDRPSPRWLAVVERRPGVSWLVALAAFLLVARGIGLTGNPAQLYSPAQYVERGALYIVVAAGLMLPALFGDPRRGVVRRFLGCRPLMWMGMISYGFYLWHWPVLLQLSAWHLNTVHAIHPYVLWLGCALPLSIALGAASWYLVERPALSLKGMVRARDRRPVAPAAEPAQAPAYAVAGPLRQA